MIENDEASVEVPRETRLVVALFAEVAKLLVAGTYALQPRVGGLCDLGDEGRMANLERSPSLRCRPEVAINTDGETPLTRGRTVL